MSGAETWRFAGAPVAFRLPASAIKVELRHHHDQWTLAYLGLSAVGLEGIDETVVHFEADTSPEAVAGYIEWRLEEAGCRPVRTNGCSAPVVAAWRV